MTETVIGDMQVEGCGACFVFGTAAHVNTHLCKNPHVPHERLYTQIKQDESENVSANPLESEAEEETDFLLCLEALAILLHSDANMRTRKEQQSQEERKTQI